MLVVDSLDENRPIPLNSDLTSSGRQGLIPIVGSNRAILIVQ